MGYVILIAIVVGFTAIIAFFAIRAHSSRRRKKIEELLREGAVSENDLLMEGYHRAGKFAMSQWVFVSINYEHVRVYAEFVMSGTRAHYDLFEFRPEELGNFTAEAREKNKIFIKFTPRQGVNSEHFSQTGGYTHPEFLLHLKPHKKEMDANAIVSTINGFGFEIGGK
ncbi:MAG: hypothetical protein FWE38_05060 [Firmicutes bacterium]|nr:hypothetical protein [Bacillota bacterium]